MTLAGTRPPTVDEWEKYELHHRSRMSTKPGITGMWQVSGRSDITDFEEVVRLDTEYIEHWTMRKSIDGLCAIIQEQFSMEIDHALFLFCGRRCDRIKAILKEPDGIVMIYKRLTAQGSYRWPRNKSEVRNLTWREFDWLMSGIDIEQPKAIKAT